MKRGFAILLIAIICCGFIPQHRAARPITVADLYAKAITALTIKHDTLEAIVALEAIFQRDSNYAPALYQLSHITKVPKNAVQYAERAYRSDTSNYYYLENFGRALIEADERTKALPVFEKIVQKSTDPNHYRILAILLGDAKNNEEALAVLDSAEVRFGRIPQMIKMRQFLLLRMGRILEAEAEAKRSVEEAPYIAENHITLGNIYASTRRDSLAVVSYHNAIAVDSLDIRSWVALANYYSRKEDMSSYLSLLPRIIASEQLPLADKISEWKTLIENKDHYRKYYIWYDTIIKQLYILNPDNLEVTYLYIDHLMASGDKEEAVRLVKDLAKRGKPTQKEFEHIIFLEEALNRPDSVAHYINLATQQLSDNGYFLALKAALAEEKKEYDKAAEIYKSVAKLVTDDKQRSGVYAAVARVEWRRDNMKGCYKAFDKALKCVKDNDTLRSDIYSALGDIEHERGDMKRVYQAYDKALKCYADNAGVLNNYAYYLSLEERDLERALEMIERALKLSDKNTTFLDTKAWVLYKLGRYAEAKRYMQQALSLYRGKDHTYALHYGDILHALGEEFMAKIYWRKALEQGADKEEIEKRFLPDKNGAQK